ncbi:MAG: DUF6873 family GME fold protein [Peptostreptococcaceae bacterium]
MKHVKNSYTLDGCLSLGIVDKRITSNMKKSLNRYQIDIIESPMCSNTYDAIKYHPDISVCKLDNNNIIVAPNVYDYYKEVLDKYHFNVIKGNSMIKLKYPNNIQYNVCIFGKYAIHNFDYTDEYILDYLNKNNFTKINVKQGYSKCSICIVDDNSIITSDVGIYNAVKKYDIDCLLIEKGYINLFELSYGFIGGCSGLISTDKLAFFGDITKHPDYYKINEFVSNKNIKIISLSDEYLLDLGSMIPLTLK